MVGVIQYTGDILGISWDNGKENGNGRNASRASHQAAS